MKVRTVSEAGATEAFVVPVAEGVPVMEEMRAAAAAAGFSGKAGEICDAYVRDRRVVLAGLGGVGDVVRAGAAVAVALARCRHITLDGHGLGEAQVARLTGAIALRSWRMPAVRKHRDKTAPRLWRIDVLTENAAGFEAAWDTEQAVLEGTTLARKLVALPANQLTPQSFVKELRRLRKYGLTLEVLNARTLRKRGYGALLAVGRGSAHPPALAVLRWNGTEGVRPVAFVGKGITFDTGGICVKPADKMWEMRADMAGAAACAGALLTLALRRAPVAAVAVLALAENALDGAAYRPGDVLTTASGRTVEVIDTDAEGRLVLADALHHARTDCDARVMVDLATLTGSIVVTLGHHMAGLFDNDAAFAEHVAEAGRAAGELCWRMPISARQRRDIDSDIADLRNCTSGRYQPDASHAAAFLREFAGDTPWVHLDIAGVESKEEADDVAGAGPTGFGVRLLDRLVAQRFEVRHMSS